DDGHWRWLSVSRPTSHPTSAALISDLAPGKRSYTLYLPLYNGTQSLKIGVPKGTAFEPIAPRSEKPLVFYGTSITHGACASRPGMPHPAILGRRLQRPVINLGFSGNGRMESEVGEFLTEVDASVFVIDCLPNMKGAEVAARAVPLVKQLRAARPQAAILLIEDRTYPNAYLLPKRQQSLAANRKALRAAYAQLRDAGVERLGYVVGDDLLGEDRDDTTDGSHPSDLGFFRQADALEKQLVKLL
ncbi:MAG: SGNH/GDSL hydrolase family protein, partial [Aureliella sp.]